MITININTQHPVNNLPSYNKSDFHEEDYLVDSFIIEYNKIATKIHKSNDREFIISKEIQINGYGIADILALSIRKIHVEDHKDLLTAVLKSKPIIRAFEVKINNWKKGLMQAYRYNFFANVSILLLPQGKINVAKRNLSLFKDLKVGLWSFDIKQNKICRIYTPRPRNAHITEYYNTALKKIVNPIIIQQS